MGDLSYRVIITNVDENTRDELISEVVALLDVSDVEADDLLEDLPLTVGKGMDEDEADDLVERLTAIGAQVKLVEVETRRRRPRRRRGAGAVSTPPSEAPVRDDEAPVGDGDDLGEDEDLDEDVEEEPGEPAEPSAGASRLPGKQRLMIIVGFVVLAVLVGLLTISVLGGNNIGFGCEGGFREPGANPQLARVLPHVAKRYARGFEPELDVAHGTLGANQSVTLHEEVAGGRCYAWIGLSPDGTDLDLFLRQGSDLVSYDDGQDNFPVVRHCIAQDATLDIEVKMFAGGGEWVVQRYVLQGPPNADLLTLMHRLYASMFVVNGEGLAPPKRLALQTGQELEVPLEMSAEWCYLPLAVSNPGTDLDMILVDPEGREVERDDAADNYPIVRHCPTKAGTYKVRLTMYRGSGEAVYQVFRGKLGSGAKTIGGAEIPEPGL